MNAELFAWKGRVANLKQFKGVCFVCHKKFGKRFLFHHLTYIEGEKTYRDFTNSEDYQRYILPIVEANPQRFMLLCHKHHSVLEKLKRFKEENLNRLIKAVKMTKTHETVPKVQNAGS